MKDKIICEWANTDRLMIEYHNEEWGVPVFDDIKIFEFLVLESAQAGLSWRTILHKREGYRRLFTDFDPKKISGFGEGKIAKLFIDPSIIRNRLKIMATVSNARKFLEIQREFGSFAQYMWGFVNGRPIDGKRMNMKSIPVVTKEAEDLAKDLKKRGFRFLGPTIIYAHMQAIGMVNDHVIKCFRYKQIKDILIQY